MLVRTGSWKQFRFGTVWNFRNRAKDAEERTASGRLSANMCQI